MHSRFWIPPLSPQVGLLSGMASAVLHALLILLLLPIGLFHASSGGDFRILPALYLYAPDRQPHTPRDLHLPLLQPLGTLVTNQPERVGGDRGRSVLPRSPVLEGVLPAGLPEFTLDSVFSVLEVDSEVARYGSSAAPLYPQSLLEAGIEGEVESQFVVDTSGKVDPASVKILFATDPEFDRSVRDALGEMSFRPAWRGKRRVRQLVQQRFRFHIEPLPPGPNAAS